jgi:hypothetical protein
MASVARALARIKSDLEPYLPEESIEAACREAGHRWRERKLGPVATLHLFVLQVRPFLVDGTGTITPDTPALQKEFGQPANQKPGCGFPVPKLLALFDAFTGMVVELLACPLYTHDLRGVWRLHPLLGGGDLLVGDRGFCSYGHLALLHLRGVLACFHMHQRVIVDFRPHRRHNARGKGGGKRERGLPSSRFVRRLGHRDQVVEWAKPKVRPKWMTPEQLASLPATLLVREVRYLLRVPAEREGDADAAGDHRHHAAGPGG